MRTVERAPRVGVGAWNDSGVTVASESAMTERAAKVNLVNGDLGIAEHTRRARRSGRGNNKMVTSILGVAATEPEATDPTSRPPQATRSPSPRPPSPSPPTPSPPPSPPSPPPPCAHCASSTCEELAQLCPTAVGLATWHVRSRPHHYHPHGLWWTVSTRRSSTIL